VIADSLHYALFGHLTRAGGLWLTYGLGTLLFPLVLVGDRLGAVMPASS
jgi:hypothetical protein